MTVSRWVKLLPGLALCALCACGGHGAGTTALKQTPDANLPVPPTPAQVSAARRAAWVKLAQNPGTPGKDYDPQRITVTYLPGATAPAGWPGAGPATGGTAASQSNPQLRQNKQYEALTDAIAAHYGLAIGQQVYIHSINFASFILPASVSGNALLPQLRADLSGEIEAAVFTPLQHAQYLPNDPAYDAGPPGPQWGHWQINCAQAWDLSKGSASVIIAVEDTGVRLTHEELAAQVIDPLTAYPAATCDLANNNQTIEDTFGHGTFIAGLICAQMDNGRTLVGAAPQSRVLPIKISNDGNAGTDVLAAGALLAGQLGAKVVNFSWGGYSDDPNEHAAVDELTADGVLFVCAAGNDGLFESDYPTAYPNALSVGATDESDTCSSFSNWGPDVDLAAPGQDLTSCGFNSDTDYASNEAGTSFAAPLVASAAALLWSYKPALTLALVRNALVSTGAPTQAFADPILRLDAGAALASFVVPVIPSVGGATPAAQTTTGAVVGQGQLQVGLVNAVNVTHVTYTLDLAPVGTAGPEDKLVESTSGGAFLAQFDLAGLKNQVAAVTARYYSSSGNSSTISVQPLWIFNQRGDIDGDGIVGSGDLAALQALLGKKRSDAAYISFADSDQDGAITEADAAAVGYNFGSGAVKPGISAVTPTSGQTGSQLAISGTVTGSGRLTYSWDFGGGATPNTSATPAPTVTLGATGTYNATLGVTSEFGTAQFPFTLTVNARPTPSAAIRPDPSGGYAPLTVNFDASTSSSPGGSIVKYEWSWDGDGNFEDTTTVPSDSHQFAVSGFYTIRLRVTNDLGLTDDATTSITLLARPGPTAVIQTDVTNGAAPLNVNLDASGSNSPGGSIVQYQWSWDNGATWGSPISSPTTTHYFESIGSYIVHLRVTDDQSATAETTKIITATDPQLPVPNYYARPTYCVTGFPVSFDATSSTAQHGPIVLYEWSWDGDQTFEDSSSTPLMTHAFSTSGDFNVILRVTDSVASTAEYASIVNVIDGKTYPAWGETDLGTFGPGESDDNLRLTAGTIGSHPAVEWIWHTQQGGNDTLFVAQGKVAAPTSLGDWQVDQVASAKMNSSVGVCDIQGELAFVYDTGKLLHYGRYKSGVYSTHTVYDNGTGSVQFGTIASIAGKPAILFSTVQGNLGSALAYAYASSDDPSSSADWTVHTITGVPRAWGSSHYNLQLSDIGGKPMFEGMGPGQNPGFLLFFASSATPGSSDWSSYRIVGDWPGEDVYGFLFSDGGLPVLIYSNVSLSVWSLNYAKSSTATPSQPSDWATYTPLDPAEPLIKMGALISGTPAIARSQQYSTFINWAKVASPTSAADWELVQTPTSTDDDRRLVSHNGLPALISINAAGDLVYRYPEP